MRLFFSAQLTALFLATPFGVAWVSNSTFKYAEGLFWIFIIAMVAQFILMTASLRTASEKWGW